MSDQDTRRRIMETAKELFFNYGSDSISMSRLAQEMKMSKKTIYKYFSSKDELTVTIMRDTQEIMKERLDAVVNDPSLSLSERIKTLVRKQVEGATVIKAPFVRDMDRHGLIRKIINNIEDNVFPSHLSNVLKEGQKNGLVREDIDLDIFMEVVKGSIDRIINFESLNRLNLSMDQAIELIFDVCLNGILTNKMQEE